MLSRCGFVFLLALGIGWHPAPAWAEWHEASVGLTGGALFPAFESASPTAFTLATWIAGFEAYYGVSDSWDVRAAFATSQFSGQSDGASANTPYGGTYNFDSRYYHPELGVRLKVFGGYRLAPYVEASVGYLWAAYTNGQVQGAKKPVPAADNAEGHFTAGGGLAVDYRLFDLCFVGLAVRYVHALNDGLSTHYVSVPLRFAYLW